MPLPLNTVITTERLRLRAVSYEDIPFVFEASQFPGFCDGMRWDPPVSPEELKEVTARNIQSWVSGSQYTFTVEWLETGLPVGRIALRSLKKGRWYIGFWVDANHWSKGIATEAAKALIAFAFDELKASMIISSHAIWNEASQRVIEKLGMEPVGENPNGFTKDGVPVPEVEYVLVPA